MKNSIAQIIKVFATVYLLFVIIGGIVLGEVYKIASSGYHYYPSYEFNWPLTIGVWVAGGITALALIGLSEVIFLLQGIKDKMPALEDEENHGSEESQEDDKKQENEENPNSEENEESKDSTENQATPVNN